MADLSTYDPIFKAAGDEWNVDPRLLRAVAMQESGGNPRAVSRAGAQGLMQIIPETQRYLGVTDPNDPVQSIYGAAKYINEGLEKEGSAEGALLYYHGGPGWRQAYGPESKAYVPAVTSHYVKLAPPPGAEAQPTPPTGPLIIGDSLASKQGLGGTGVVGAQPKAVLDSISALPDDQVNGRDVVLSSGASNNPAQAALVEQQIKTLKDRGATSVTVVGVGDHPKLAGVNDTLSGIAEKNGARFVPVPADQFSGDRIHPTGAGYRTLLAAATPRTATDANPAPATPPAPATGPGNAMANADLPSWLPPSPQAGGATNAAPAMTGASDDLPSWLPPAPKAVTTATAATPTSGGGIARNVAAGVLEGAGAVGNVLSDPFGNLIARPALTAGAFLYDLAAPHVGLPRLTPEQRADLLSDKDMPQAGTRAIEGIGGVVGAQPSQVPATTEAERLARSGASGATAGLLIPGAMGPVMGASGAVTGNVAGQYVPEWAAPAAELAGNVVGGGGAYLAARGGNALLQGARELAGPPGSLPPNYSPLSPPPPPPEPILPGVNTLSAEAAARAEAHPAGPKTDVPAGAAGAQVTPAYEAIHTPAEEAAYRANAEGQKLIEGQKLGEADLNQYIPGETVNNAQREQTAKAARELKELGIRVPEASQMEKLAEESNDTARKVYTQNTSKGQIEITNRRTDRETDIKADKAQVFAPDNVTGPVDFQPVVAQMEAVLREPENRQNSALQSVYREQLERIKEAKIENPAEAWGLRRDLDRLTDKRMAAKDPNLHYVAHHLDDVAGMIDTQIEKVAPGYSDMLAKYKEHSRAINEMEVLQGALDKLRGPGQKLTYNDFQRFMKNVVDSRMTPSTDLNAFKAISEENMQRLWNIRDSLRRTASAKELASAAGSDTMPNIIDALKAVGKMGGTAALHAYVGAHLGPGGNLALQSLTAVGKSLNDRRMIRRTMRQMNQLLRPSEPLRVPPGQENALSGAPPP